MSEVRASDYCFAVQEASGGRFVEMEPRECDAAAIGHLQSVWQRLHGGLQGHHKLCGRPAPEWASWKPWDWCSEKKPGYEQRRKYIAWCGDSPVGFVNVWPDFLAIHAAPSRILYLEHVAAAPGCQTTELWNRRFTKVGAALFAYVVLLSKLQGFEGRVGLHVASEEAGKFYEAMESRCGGGLFHPVRTDVSGPTPRGELERSKSYLETQESGATRWLEEYRRG